LDSQWGKFLRKDPWLSKGESIVCGRLTVAELTGVDNRDSITLISTERSVERVVEAETKRRRRGRQGSSPASERAVPISTYLKPSLYDWVREEAVRRNCGMAPFLADLIAEMRRMKEEEASTEAPNPPPETLAP
jgi:hypothetical protein